MAAPCRRSSRLRGVSATPAINPVKDASSTANLSSLVERDESPADGSRPNIDAIVSSPTVVPNAAVSQSGSHIILSSLRTPNIDSRFRPAIEEIHPSKTHRSTNQQVEPKPQPLLNNARCQTSANKPASTDSRGTPTKLPGSWPTQITSTFDFSVAQNDSILSRETQRIMENVREEAAKVKAKMQAERAKQDSVDEEVDQFYAGGVRKIAQPKGKAGRYSDAHKEEFKKMGSIVDHASLWKNKTQNDTALSQPNQLKGDTETIEPVQRLSRSKSCKVLIRSNDNDRLENPAPGKRSKKSYHEDTSAARPLSRGKKPEDECVPATPLKTGSKFSLPTAIYTPTKASLARSASVKSMKTSMIPSLSRSNSLKMTDGLIMPRTEGSKKYISALTRFDHMKSILHRQPKLSIDPVKKAAGSHLPTPAALRLDKELPSLPATSQTGPDHIATITKRVDFTPNSNSNSKNHLEVASPSPSKIPTLNLPRQPDTPKASEEVLYPSLANSPNITTRTKIPGTSAPGDFTFRSDKTIQFAPVSSSSKTPTIRQVRPSGITTPLAVFEELPPIPHGMPNKKRHRSDSDNENEENIPPQGSMNANDSDEPKAKRLRGLPKKEKQEEATIPREGSKFNRAGKDVSKAGVSKEKRKRVLTLSRLNMLARPKNRR